MKNKKLKAEKIMPFLFKIYLVLIILIMLVSYFY